MLTRLLDGLFAFRVWLGWYPAGRITWDETGSDWAPVDPSGGSAAASAPLTTSDEAQYPESLRGAQIAA